MLKGAKNSYVHGFVRSNIIKMDIQKSTCSVQSHQKIILNEVTEVQKDKCLTFSLKIPASNL